MYVRSSGLPTHTAWYVAKLSTRSAYDAVSGDEPRPALKSKWRMRASSSRGWNGARQKSSKRSSRCSRSASCAPVTSKSTASTRASPLRSARHTEKAPSGSSSAQTTAPDHPSGGSCCIATAAFVTAFHGCPARSNVCASSAGGGSGYTSSMSPIPRIRALQRLQVAVNLERRDVSLVVGPFTALVQDEVLEDVLAQCLGHEFRAFHHF